MKTFQNFIAGAWVEPSTGEYFENVNPADTTRRHRPLPALRAPTTSTRAVASAQARLRGLATHAGARARRRAATRRRPHASAQGRDRGPHDARDGQAARRDARRRAGGDRHGVLRGHRRAPAVRPHRAERAAEQMGDELPPADRRVRAHHAVQLPDGDPDLEDVSGAVCGNCVHLQAGRGRAAHRRRCSSRSCSRRGCRPR